MEKIYRVQMNAKGMPNFSTAVEVADRPQGEWVATDDTDEWYGPTYKCNICGSDAIGGHDNYCYNCGAKMKGADDE